MPAPPLPKQRGEDASPPPCSASKCLSCVLKPDDAGSHLLLCQRYEMAKAPSVQDQRFMWRSGSRGLAQCKRDPPYVGTQEITSQTTGMVRSKNGGPNTFLPKETRSLRTQMRLQTGEGYLYMCGVLGKAGGDIVLRPTPELHWSQPPNIFVLMQYVYGKFRSMFHRSRGCKNPDAETLHCIGAYQRPLASPQSLPPRVHQRI